MDVPYFVVDLENLSARYFQGFFYERVVGCSLKEKPQLTMKTL